MAEYGMIVTSIDLKPGIEDAAKEEIGVSLTNALGQVVQKTSKGLPSLQGGGWEIVSHNLMRLQSHLIVSLLIRR
jgi:hypothetical protein